MDLSRLGGTYLNNRCRLERRRPELDISRLLLNLNICNALINPTICFHVPEHDLGRVAVDERVGYDAVCDLCGELYFSIGILAAVVAFVIGATFTERVF